MQSIISVHCPWFINNKAFLLLLLLLKFIKSGGIRIKKSSKLRFQKLLAQKLSKLIPKLFFSCRLPFFFLKHNFQLILFFSFWFRSRQHFICAKYGNTIFWYKQNNRIKRNYKSAIDQNKLSKCKSNRHANE